MAQSIPGDKVSVHEALAAGAEVVRQFLEDDSPQAMFERVVALADALGIGPESQGATDQPRCPVCWQPARWHEMRIPVLYAIGEWLPDPGEFARAHFKDSSPANTPEYHRAVPVIDDDGRRLVRCASPDHPAFWWSPPKEVGRSESASPDQPTTPEESREAVRKEYSIGCGMCHGTMTLRQNGHYFCTNPVNCGAVLIPHAIGKTVTVLE